MGEKGRTSRSKSSIRCAQVKAGFEKVLLVDSSAEVVGMLSGGRGPFGCRDELFPTRPDDQLWSGELHQEGMWSPSLCLGPWVWFRDNGVFKSFGSQPNHEVLSAKGSSQKEKSSLLEF